MSADFKSLKIAVAETLKESPAQTERMRRLQALCVRCESPIEKDMAQALLDNPRLNASGSITIWTNDAVIEGTGKLTILVQSKLGRFRPDFMLYMQDGRQVLIECDGIEWHDRTNQQFISERQRERDLLILGWPTMRFTGSEITRNPDACAADVAAYLTGAGA